MVWPFATGKGGKKQGKVGQEGANMGPYKMCNVAHTNITYKMCNVAHTNIKYKTQNYKIQNYRLQNTKGVYSIDKPACLIIRFPFGFVSVPNRGRGSAIWEKIPK